MELATGKYELMQGGEIQDKTKEMMKKISKIFEEMDKLGMPHPTPEEIFNMSILQGGEA